MVDHAMRRLLRRSAPISRRFAERTDHGGGRRIGHAGERDHARLSRADRPARGRGQPIAVHRTRRRGQHFSSDLPARPAGDRAHRAECRPAQEAGADQRGAQHGRRPTAPRSSSGTGRSRSTCSGWTRSSSGPGPRWPRPRTSGCGPRWQRGHFVASDTLARQRHLHSGTTYRLGSAGQQRMILGGSAPLGIDGIGALVSSKYSAGLGLIPGVLALISAPGASLAALTKAVQQHRGPAAQVDQPAQPGAAAASAEPEGQRQPPRQLPAAVPGVGGPVLPGDVLDRAGRHRADRER